MALSKRSAVYHREQLKTNLKMAFDEKQGAIFTALWEELQQAPIKNIHAIAQGFLDSQKKIITQKNEKMLDAIADLYCIAYLCDLEAMNKVVAETSPELTILRSMKLPNEIELIKAGTKDKAKKITLSEEKAWQDAITILFKALAFVVACAAVATDLESFKHQLAAGDAGVEFEIKLEGMKHRIDELSNGSPKTEIGDVELNQVMRFESQHSLLEIDLFAQRNAQSPKNSVTDASKPRPKNIVIPSAKRLYRWTGLTSFFGVPGLALASFALLTLHPAGLLATALLAGLALSGALILGASVLFNRARRRAQVAGYLAPLQDRPDLLAEFFVRNKELREQAPCLSSMTREMRMLILQFKILIPKAKGSELAQCSVLTENGDKKDVHIYFRPSTFSLWFMNSKNEYKKASDSESVFKEQFANFCPATIAK